MRRERKLGTELEVPTEKPTLIGNAQHVTFSLLLRAAIGFFCSKSARSGMAIVVTGSQPQTLLK
jgi:hypothetical protein